MDNNVIEFPPERLAKLRNLRPYKGKSDAEIIASVNSRKAKPRPVPKDTVAPNVKSYDSRFNEKMKILLKEFELDMNNSNDKEALNALVRQQIQLENVGRDIDALQTADELSKDDYARLKSLGDFQRSLITSITDLTGTLGVSRKIRKEKAVDDIPQWIDGVLARAKEFYDKKTVEISCPKCMIELSRYWLNFPGEKNDIRMQLTCWKCKETIMHIG